MKKTLIFSLLILASLGSAQIVKQGPGYLFRMKLVAGQVMTYGVVSSMGGFSSSGKPMEFTLPMIWKVVSVQKGVATVDTTVGPVTVGKQQMIKASTNRVQID